MPQIFNLQRLIFASVAFAIMVMASSTAWADPIVITTGNPGNQGTDNVLFNNGSLVHSGLLVQGDFNGAGAGFIVDFTSASGSGNTVTRGDGLRISRVSGAYRNPCLMSTIARAASI